MFSEIRDLRIIDMSPEQNRGAGTDLQKLANGREILQILRIVFVQTRTVWLEKETDVFAQQRIRFKRARATAANRLNRDLLASEPAGRFERVQMLEIHEPVGVDRVFNQLQPYASTADW